MAMVSYPGNTLDAVVGKQQSLNNLLQVVNGIAGASMQQVTYIPANSTLACRHHSIRQDDDIEIWRGVGNGADLLCRDLGE